MQQFRHMAVLSGVALALLGCSRMSDIAFNTRLDLGSVGLGERCGDFMQRAFPESGLEITGTHVVPGSDHTTVTVDAVRSEVPANGIYARDVAVECRFDNGVLTGFRWTAGPVRPASADQPTKTGPAP